MTSIGLIGAPGVGKSALAWEIQGRLPGFEVLDGYADDLAEDLDITLGSVATYIPNVMLAMQRERYERELQVMGHSCISVGTIVESFAYAGLSIEFYSNLPSTDQNRMDVLKELTAGQLLSLMLLDVYRYTHLFYLPSGEREGLPARLDEAIETIIEKFKLPALKLTGSLADKVEAVMNAVKS